MKLPLKPDQAIKSLLCLSHSGQYFLLFITERELILCFFFGLWTPEGESDIIYLMTHIKGSVQNLSWMEGRLVCVFLQMFSANLAVAQTEK